MTKTRNQPRTPAVAAAVRDEAPASTKTARLLAMLETDDGASVEEISDALGWLQHTVRAALTGLRKKGHDIVRGKHGSVTTYRIAS